MKAKRFLCICLLCVLCLPGSKSLGAAMAAEPKNPESARRLARDVLSRQETPASKIEYRWVRREQKAPERRRDSPWWQVFSRWLETVAGIVAGLRQSIARLGKVGILLALAAVLLLYLLYTRRLGPWLFARQSEGSAGPPQPEMLFGLDVRPESLPGAPDQASLTLWSAGRKREALALLYRAALSRFIHDHRLSLHPSLTELECQKQVARQRQGAQSAYFKRLTACWIRMAYGHEQLDEGLHHELVRGWREAFD